MKATTGKGKPRCQDTIASGPQCIREAKFDAVETLLRPRHTKCRQHSQAAKERRRRDWYELATKRRAG